LDLSGHLLVAETQKHGSFTVTGLMNFVRGENRTTGDDLYNIMPWNLKLALVHRLAGWSGVAEFQTVAAKTHVSQVRNEMQTGAYRLLHLRSSYDWKHMRLDASIENVFNSFYSMPLGGAYVGQGASMTSNGIPWGTPIPGMGRSFHVALNVRF
jgi:iron complex outermembrane receptor protein